jgi:hypothetical protein
VTPAAVIGKLKLAKGSIGNGVDWGT